MWREKQEILLRGRRLEHTLIRDKSKHPVMCWSRNGALARAKARSLAKAEYLSLPSLGTNPSLLHCIDNGVKPTCKAQVLNLISSGTCLHILSYTSKWRILGRSTAWAYLHQISTHTSWYVQESWLTTCECQMPEHTFIRYKSADPWMYRNWKGALMRLLRSNPQQEQKSRSCLPQRELRDQLLHPTMYRTWKAASGARAQV